jgi:hypothetical protein
MDNGHWAGSLMSIRQFLAPLACASEGRHARASNELRADLRAVLALLDSPEKWTKGEMARDSSGHRCFANRPNAACWSLPGAIMAVTEDREMKIMNYIFVEQFRQRNLDVLIELRKYIPQIPKRQNIYSWHEAPERTFEDIRDILNKALDGCKEEPSA